jgi:two-component system LytT family response regulator
MITAVIIDDEKNALEVLEMQLASYCKEVTVLDICSSGKEGIEAIRKHQPNLVFIDIEMPHINGFDVLNATKEYNYKVIFTTAYDQFAIKAFKVSAIDYLLKPIDIVDLQNAVVKVNVTQKNDLETKIESLFNQYKNQNNPLSKIALPIGNSIQFFDTNEILRVESESNYSHIYLENKKKITLSKTLKEVEATFNGNPFFRVHQSHLINMNYIDKVMRGENPYIVMKDGTSITISRNKKEAFFDQFRKI